MEYEGKLYGKFGGEYFPMIETTKDINRYKQRIKELEEQVLNTESLHDVSCCDCKKELEDAKESIKDMQDELNYHARR
jgi:hypothetical protein